MKKNYFNARLVILVLAGLLVFTLSWATTTSKVETLVAISAPAATSSATHSYEACCQTSCNKWSKTCRDHCYQACTFTDDETLSAPSNVAATATSSSKITVSWSSVSSATGYYVYRGTSSSLLSNIKTLTATTYSDTGLAAATKYYYYVVAYSSSSTSSNSSTVSATTSAAAPGIPSGITASALSTSSIKITWTAVTSATGYYIYRGTSATALSKKITATATPYSDTGLTSNTTYYYGVAAYNASGTSDTSTIVNTKTNSTGIQPQQSNVFASANGNNRIIEAYKPNGQLVVSTIVSSIVLNKETINSLGLRAGVYHLVIKDAVTGKSLLSQKVAVVR